MNIHRKDGYHMTVEEAVNLMDDEAYAKLKEVVTVKPSIDISKKSANDILMGALCKAVLEDVIHVESLDEKIIKLLNSPTNTLSQSKLKYVLNVVHETQPKIKCIITIMTPDMKDTLFEVEYHQPDAIDFIVILKWLVKKFDITPTKVRSQMNALKPTIVNNIAQLVSRVLNDNLDGVTVSISTITRLVNCNDHLIYAKFE